MKPLKKDYYLTHMLLGLLMAQRIARHYKASLLKKSKTYLWKGDAENGLIVLEELKTNVDSSEIKSKINGIHSYINRNKEYISDYTSKAKEGKSYTSQVAESMVEHVINDRHKRNQKMQWRDAVFEVIKLAA